MTKLSCNILPPCHPPTNWRKTPKGVTLDSTFCELFFLRKTHYLCNSSLQPQTKLGSTIQKYMLPLCTNLTRVGNQLNVIPFQDDLILHRGIHTCDTGSHSHTSYVLLAEEVTHLHQGVILRDSDVNWEMSIHCLHLILVALKNLK